MRILLNDTPDRGALHTTTSLPYFEVPIKVSPSLSDSTCLLAGVATRLRLVLRVGSHTTFSLSAPCGSTENLFRVSAKEKPASEARTLFDAKIDPPRILAISMTSKTSDLASMQLYLSPH
ncbi:hypothetical protein KVT40_003690 [Elsinoe batatas]|uniref:Uncharacterized protein n=1 Tax=Elsinoe batatas TaxID=2601811 RepID=A0A8K0L2B7_9PEZI|nr:hypothetical protein KVT40_003690 [Elsinoe batatas]